MIDVWSFVTLNNSALVGWSCWGMFGCGRWAWFQGLDGLFFSGPHRCSAVLSGRCSHITHVTRVTCLFADGSDHLGLFGRFVVCSTRKKCPLPAHQHCHRHVGHGSNLVESKAIAAIVSIRDGYTTVTGLNHHTNRQNYLFQDPGTQTMDV